MSKYKGRVREIAKRTRASGLVFVDVESGMYVGMSNDVESERTSSRGDASAERRSQPPGRPNFKLSRN